MSKMLDCFVAYLVRQKFVETENMELVQFGLMQGVFYLANICMTLLIGSFFHETYASACFLLSFMAIRTYAGGFHARSVMGCFAASIVIVVLVIASVHYLPLTGTFVLLLAVLSGIVLWNVSPVDNQKRRLECDEKLKYRRMARKILLIEIFIISIGRGLAAVWLYEGVTAALFVTSVLAVTGRLQMRRAQRENDGRRHHLRY